MTNSKSFDMDLFLEPNKMIQLYALGFFPMAEENSNIVNWFNPEVRTIIPLDSFNIPRSLKKVLQENKYEVRIDFDFQSVVRNCANREETWISKKLINAYMGLYNLGHIHTVEIWNDNILVGGLYGVTYKGAFFGESMFSFVPQASKIALVTLCRHLKKKGFVLLDVQYMTKHLEMFGAIEISLTEYRNLLKRSSLCDVSF